MKGVIKSNNKASSLFYGTGDSTAYRDEPKFPFILLVDINNFYKELIAILSYSFPYFWITGKTLSFVVHCKLFIDIEVHRKFAIHLYLFRISYMLDKD